MCKRSRRLCTSPPLQRCCCSAYTPCVPCWHSRWYHRSHAPAGADMASISQLKSVRPLEAQPTYSRVAITTEHAHPPASDAEEVTPFLTDEALETLRQWVSYTHSTMELWVYTRVAAAVCSGCRRTTCQDQIVSSRPLIADTMTRNADI